MEATFICRDHGRFKQQAQAHLNGINRCPGCFAKMPTQTEKLVARFVERFGARYDYSLVAVRKGEDHITVVCKTNGAFNLSPGNFIASPEGCPACSKAESLGPRISREVIIGRFVAAHDAGRYTYEKFEYTGQHDLSIITCTRHGDFLMSAANHGTKHGCTRCNNNTASKEENLWIAAIEDELGETSERSVRVSSRRGATLDAVFGKVAVEYDGAYWHALPGALDKDIRKTATAITDGFQVVRIRAADPKHPPLPDVPNARNIHVGNRVTATGLTEAVNAVREARK